LTLAISLFLPLIARLTTALFKRAEPILIGKAFRTLMPLSQPLVTLTDMPTKIGVEEVLVLKRVLSFTKQTIKTNRQTRRDRTIISLTKVKTKLSH
jgi:hypothetical protein